jgi:anti-sigma factor ChrR (cupin superfamily)
VVDGFNVKDTGSIPWRPSTFAKGVDVKDLGTTDGLAMQLVRFEPGAAFPPHVHTGPEFIFLIDGEIIQNGQTLKAGWSCVAAVGTRDMEFRSAAGCVLLIVYGR